MECACKYFAQAIKLNPTNMRALFGLFLVSCNTYIYIFTASSEENVTNQGARRFFWTGSPSD